MLVCTCGKGMRRSPTISSWLMVVSRHRSSLSIEVHNTVAKFYSELPACFGVVEVIGTFVKQSRPIQLGPTVPFWVRYLFYQSCEITPGLLL